VFREWLAKKLLDRCISLYLIKEVVSTNAIKLKPPTSIRIHPVVNISQVVCYKKQVKGQKIEEIKPVEVEEVKE